MKGKGDFMENTNLLQDDDFEMVYIDQKYSVLFSEARLDRNIIPDGLYVYECRHSDDTDEIVAEICSKVRVNHSGTILCREEIPLDENGSYFPEIVDFAGWDLTVEEYLKINKDMLNPEDVENILCINIMIKATDDLNEVEIHE